MKLLYVTNGINGAGGLERVLSVKASLLAEKYNYQITILSLNDNYINPFYIFSDKIEMISIPVSGNFFQYFKSYTLGIRNIVKMLNPDIISVCDDGLKGFFLPLILGNSCPLIYERHVSKLIEMNYNFGWFKKLTIKIKLGLMNHLAKKFSKFIVLTNGNVKEWSFLKNIQVIPNPLSFSPDKVAQLDNKRIICVGKISYQKGQDLLMEAWKNVVSKHPDWKLDLYGKLDDGVLNIPELHPSVKLYMPEANIEEKYLESSIYVMSSRYEGFGMVLIEAMACGLPCISFNCNYGPSDIIQDQYDGILVDNDDVNGLSNAIISLIENKILRKKMGEFAKVSANKYKPCTILPQWDELFQLLKRNKNSYICEI